MSAETRARFWRGVRAAAVPLVTAVAAESMIACGNTTVNNYGESSSTGPVATSSSSNAPASLETGTTLNPGINTSPTSEGAVRRLPKGRYDRTADCTNPSSEALLGASNEVPEDLLILADETHAGFLITDAGDPEPITITTLTGEEITAGSTDKTEGTVFVFRSPVIARLKKAFTLCVTDAKQISGEISSRRNDLKNHWGFAKVVTEDVDPAGMKKETIS